MTKYRNRLTLSVLALAVWLGPRTAAAEEVVSASDITVQARGPVHEAYAEPVESRPQPGPAIPKQPPEPVPEEPPAQKPEGDNVQWLGGYWTWDEDRKDFTWVSGFWRVPPPDRKWVPGYWTQVEDGWQWVAGFWAPNSQESVDYLQQPPASIDNGPATPAPDDSSIYTPGTWVYRSTRYVWRPGFWLGARPGFVWTSAHYCYTPSGYVFLDGYWDRPLEDRGLLFAPVCFNRPLWNDPDWVYRPSYCVDVPALLSSFFVRPGYSHYYFGDYYGRDYARLGFSPWDAYGRRYHDPLFSYYRWAHRDDPGWSRGLRSDYLGRFNGELSRPPRTLEQQNARNSRSLQVVRPLSEVNNVRLSRLDRSQVANFRNVDRSYRQVSLARAGLERPGRSLVGRSAPLSLSRVPRSRSDRVARSQTFTPRVNGNQGNANRSARQGQGNFSNGTRPYRPSNLSRPNTTQPPRRGTSNYTSRPYAPTIRPSRSSSSGNVNRPAPRQRPTYSAYSGNRPRQRPANAAARPSSGRPSGNRQATQRSGTNFNRPARPAARSQPRPAYKPAPSRSATPRYQPPRNTYRPSAQPQRSNPRSAARPASRPAPVHRAAASRPQPRPAARPVSRPAPVHRAAAPRPAPKSAPASHGSKPASKPHKR